MLAVGVFGVAACGRNSGSTPPQTVPTLGTPGPDEAIATDAYVFGYPLVIMDVTREHSAPENRFDHARSLPDAANRSLVRPNEDTLYSKAWLDLRTEPVVLQVPAMDAGRYWLMQTMDMWTNVAQNPSSVRPQVKSGATGPFTYAFTPPGWNGTLPDGITQLPMPTPQGWILGRIAVNGAADLPAVHAIQDQLLIAPLSEWSRRPGAGNPAAAAPGPADPVAIVAKMDGRTFFDRLCAVMAIDAPAPEDAAALDRFAHLGIRPGGSVDDVPAEVLDAAVTAGLGRVEDYRDPGSHDFNGWTYSADTGRYGTNYDQRAYVARGGLGANLPEDAIYPNFYGTADASGVPRTFRVHFEPGQLPPVEAFWSLTAYAADSFLIPNSAGIYAVGHQVPVTPNADGSVDIAAQYERPGPEIPAANWLPIPETGAFTLTLRLYAPKSPAVDRTWTPPPVTTP